MKKILVTGGSGFIGKHLISTLVKKYDVYSYGRRSNSEATHLFGSILDKEALRQSLSSTDTIIHCAGISDNKSYTERELEKINVTATKQIAELCLDLKIKRIIYISTIKVNGSRFNLNQVIKRASEKCLASPFWPFFSNF